MAAGDKVPWSYIATRVATTTVIADSSTWTTTETGTLFSVTAPLVSGLVYKISLWTVVSASAVASPSAELSVMRIREDTAAGTQLQGVNVYMGTASTVGHQVFAIAEYTAVSTASKVFCVTGQRTGGANNHQIRAGASRPTYLTVELIPV